MQSKATRRGAHAVVRVRRLLIEIFSSEERDRHRFDATQPGPASRMKLAPLIAFIAMIAGWAVVAGLVGLALLVFGLL